MSYWVLKLISVFLVMLPLSWSLWIGRALGRLWHYGIPIRRGIARRNVARVFEDKLSPREQRRMVRRCFENLGMFAVEVFRLPALSAAQSERLVERQGWHHLEQALQKGRGVIAVTAHMGNYDLAASSQAIRGVPINAVVKQIHWHPAHRFIVGARERAGLKLIAPRKSKDDIRKSLHQGEIVTFVIDQHMVPHRGIVCRFFGQLASTTPAPTRFALETGAPIIPLWIRRTKSKGHHVLIIEPEFVLETPHTDHNANLRHNTERLNRLVESWIQQEPEQWLWLHQRWKVQDNPEGWSIPGDLRQANS